MRKRRIKKKRKKKPEEQEKRNVLDGIKPRAFELLNGHNANSTLTTAITS